VTDYGRIIAAGIEVDGSELSSDHLAGVTILDLEDALDFIEPEYGETRPRTRRAATRAHPQRLPAAPGG
jgi:hypothetical protein